MTAVAWSPDGGLFAAAGVDGVHVWRPTTGWRGRPAAELVRTLVGHTRWIGAVAWSPDGSRLAGTGNDGTLRLWDPGSGAETACIDTDHRDRVHSVAWSADGHHLATCDDTGLVIIWDRAGNEITSLVLRPSQCLAWERSWPSVNPANRPCSPSATLPI